MHSENKQMILYGTTWCGDTIRARRFLDSKNIPYLWVDIDKDPEAWKLVESINHGYRSVPTIVFPDGSTLTEPSTSVLAQKLNI
ncbi:MAG: glutaredoxin domain-containing protein [Anaerolineaceae bacterium]